MSMEDAVELSTQIRRLFPLYWYFCVVGHYHVKEDIVDLQDLAPLYYHRFGLMREGLRGKYYPSDAEVKTVVMKWLKE